MISIYILPTDELQTLDFFELTDSLPFGENEKNRLLAISNSKHRWESLGGLIALHRLMRTVSPTDIRKILRATAGKPYFEGDSALPFSISHSHGICAAAVATHGHCEIGLDIEVIDESYVRAPVAERFFTADEKLRFELSEHTPESFFAIWTAKEARSKIDGKGLGAFLAAKEASGDPPVYVSQLTLEISGKRIAAAVCSHIAGETIRIYSDSEVIK